MKRLLRRRAFPPILGMVFLTGLLFMTLPLGHAVWTEVLGVSGSVSTGSWLPPPPSRAGTSLEADVTAEGFWEQLGGSDRTGVRGHVCVINSGDFPTENLSILDVVQIKIGSTKFADYLAVALDLGANPVLDPGEYHCYPYEFEFLPVEKANFRNVAHVTITNHAGWLPGGARCPGPDPCPFGPQPKASFKLPCTPDSGEGNISKVPPDPTGQTPTLPPTLAPLPSATPTPTSPPVRVSTATPSPTAELTPTPTATEIPKPTPTIAPTDDPSPGCTHSAEFWGSYPDLWPVDMLRMGERDYTKAEALDILGSQSLDDVSIVLARQLTAARLNAASGADIWEVLDALSGADAWLALHLPGSSPLGSARSAGLALAGSLESFNLGLTGPGICMGELPTPPPTQPVFTWTPTPTDTATGTPVIEETPTQAPTGTATSTPPPSPTPTGIPPTGEPPEPSPTPVEDSPTPPPPTPSEAPTAVP